MEQTKLKTLELNAAKARLYGVQMVHDAASGHPRLDELHGRADVPVLCRNAR